MSFPTPNSPDFLNPGATTNSPPETEHHHTAPVRWTAPQSPKIKSWRLKYLAVLGLVLAGGAGAAYILPHQPAQAPTPATPQAAAPTEAKNLTFLLEIYDQVKQRYWDKITDADLSNIYKLALEKFSNKLQQLDPPNRDGVETMLKKALEPLSEADKKALAVNVGDVVLANLKPFSRSRLYTSQNQQALQNQVKNVDPSTNFYQTLGVKRTATLQEITHAFEQKSAELKRSKATDAELELSAVARAYQALGTAESRARYDKVGAEPTVVGRVVKGKTLYIKISRISPPTVQELAQVAENFGKNLALRYLVMDLRGNVGGDIDVLPYFLGLFLGPSQYAYEFYHQGDTTPFKTKVGWLPSLTRFKQVVVLIDGETQSSAEVIADTLKKYHVAVLVGVKTKGWGTVESVVPLTTVIDPAETYSMLLVHSVTLRDDGQAIQGRGVEPQVKTSDAAWPKQLQEYYNFPELTAVVRELLAQTTPKATPKK